MLYAHKDKLQSHLFSPTHLRFTIDFENHYDAATHKKAEMAARVVTREWERNDIDTTFGAGVGEALTYGACLQKLLVKKGSPLALDSRLVQPWQFWVYNEGVNGLDHQEACGETLYLNKHEVWRRIAHLPNAADLYKRILAHSTKDGGDQPSSFIHQVLSTAILDTSLQNATQPMPGGIVQLSNDPSSAMLGPQVGVDLIPMHELWVKDDDLNDWITVQIIEPDILVAPLFKRVNLFCPDTLPYELIQPNHVPGYFFGRSELVDLMVLQGLLSTHLDDIKRLMGVQFDKLLAFPGYDGITDELYSQFRSNGYVGLPQGASVTDLTPKMPEQALPFIGEILGLMDKVSGFDNILAGRGEPGVRAGNHADTLMRTASPRLRDRALIVERQCASLGDKTLAVMEAKDGRAYFPTESIKEEDAFLLENLPDDRRITVDSHSSSPIYEEDHQQLVAFLLKAGVIDGASALEMLQVPNQDVLIKKFEQAQQAKAAFLQAHPELAEQHGKKKAA